MNAMSGILTQKGKTITTGQIRQAVMTADVNAEISKHIDKILKRASEEESGTLATLEAVGFARGVVESYLVNRYMETFTFTPELFNMNEISDREALGVLLTRLFVSDKEVFASNEALKNYFKESSNTLMKNIESKTMAEQKKETVLFVNNLINDIDSNGFIADEPDQLVEIAISLAIINDSINKISFNRIVEDAKRRIKPTTNAVKSILSSA